MIEWTDKLSTGSAKIDEQHKELFVHINNLLAALSDGRSKQQLPELITFLEDYVIRHFNEEDRFMVAVSYPEMEGHLAQHKLFLRRMNDLKQMIESDSDSDRQAKAASDLLVKWFTNHIMILDRDLGSYLKKA